MENAQIISRAENYIKREENRFFADQVKNLLEKKDMDELSDRFYTGLTFGTGGLRGVIGGGDNRMNSFNIKKATQGLANYIKKKAEGDLSIAISYDSRNFSREFAEDAALVMAGNGIKAYLFSSLRPTPMLSYAVRQLGASAGIMVTASHNPAEYNGYKVFWNDGAQVVAPHDTGIIAEVEKVGDSYSSLGREEALEKGLLEVIDEKIDSSYDSMVKQLAIREDLFAEYGKKIKVVFTPLHGTGALPVKRALESMGIEVIEVSEQWEPNGDFPTVAFPNPEEASAMKLALELAKKKKANLVIGTDPDADRIGIAVPKGDDFTLITGNQLGAMLTEYIFSSMKDKGSLPEDPAFVNTIVTTKLQNSIAESYGAKTFRVLTGFKFIGDKIAAFEQQEKGPEFVFGGEESYGFLVGDKVRDKDAVSAAALTAEMAMYDLSKGRSLLDRLEAIYEKYGYYEEFLVSRYFKGQSGKAVMDGLMKDLRENGPKKLGGMTVVSMIDFLTGETVDRKNGGREKNIDLPSSNVLQFSLEDGSVVTARPSGTEPKIKFYASCRASVEGSLEEAKKMVSKKIEALKKDIQALIPE